MVTKKQRVLHMKSQFDKALETLREAVFEKDVNQYVKDATIQRFEYTYELSWKLIKFVLESKGLLLRYPKELYSEAFSAGWLKDPLVWESMIEDRNLTSHIYGERTAEDVYKSIISTYYQEFKTLQLSLNEVIEHDLRNT